MFLSELLNVIEDAHHPEAVQRADFAKQMIALRKAELEDSKAPQVIWLDRRPGSSQGTASTKKRKRALSSEPSTPNVDIAMAPPVPDVRYDPVFTDPEASVVLTSADGVSYRMHPFTLRTSSKLPAVPAKLDESSPVLGRLFRMISGLGAGRWESIDEVDEALIAAHKYQMPGPILDMRCTALSPFLAKYPLKVFLIAARYDWEDEAKLASTHTLSISIHDEKYAPLLDANPSPYLTRLFRLHRTRRDSFKAHITRGSRCFGIEVCPYCQKAHSPNNAPALRDLMNSMGWEMDRQPDGARLLASRWKEWKAYRDGRLCPKYTKLQGSEYGELILRDVKACLDALPSTI
ncbi:hypothetical protein HWV62_2902 [Athelia sp. TMB]|nr:hypothetical protein HWV62_2902 [Athelia sp. TMB]